MSEPKAAPGSMAQLVFGPAPAKSVKLALEAVVSQVDGLNFPVSWQFFLTCFFKLEVTLKKIAESGVEDMNYIDISYMYIYIYIWSKP